MVYGCRFNIFCFPVPTHNFNPCDVNKTTKVKVLILVVLVLIQDQDHDHEHHCRVEMNGISKCCGRTDNFILLGRRKETQKKLAVTL